MFLAYDLAYDNCVLSAHQQNKPVDRRLIVIMTYVNVRFSILQANLSLLF